MAVHLSATANILLKSTFSKLKWRVKPNGSNAAATRPFPGEPCLPDSGRSAKAITHFLYLSPMKASGQECNWIMGRSCVETRQVSTIMFCLNNVP
jgi:hypothetical protein